MTWVDISFDVRSYDPDSWGPSWGLTWEAAQDDLSPRGRSSFVKFRPVQRGAAELFPATARAQGYSRITAAGAGRSLAHSQAGAVSLPFVAATAGTAAVRPRGVSCIGAVARLRGIKVCAGVRGIATAAGAMVAPYSAAAVSHVRSLQPEAAGVASISSRTIGAWLRPTQPIGVQNLTDEELIGIFLQARRKSPLTGRVNHL